MNQHQNGRFTSAATTSIGIRVILCFWVLALLGCQNRESKMSIHGQVSLDNQAIESGKILFLPNEQGLPQAVGQIREGKYQIGKVSGLFPGSYEVQIYGYRGTGKFDDLGPLHGNERRERQEQFLPARFNVDSVVSTEIEANQEQYDFELTN